MSASDDKIMQTFGDVSHSRYREILGAALPHPDRQNPLDVWKLKSIARQSWPIEAAENTK
jgi:hypothetical protein